MTLPQVFGELLPGAYLDLLAEMRAKYHIQSPASGKDSLADSLCQEIPLEQLRDDIYQRIRRQLSEEHPLASLLRPFLRLPPDVPIAQALRAAAEIVPDDRTVGNTIYPLADRLLEPHARRLAVDAISHTEELVRRHIESSSGLSFQFLARTTLRRESPLTLAPISAYNPVTFGITEQPID